jgi:hypothetical protein
MRPPNDNIAFRDLDAELMHEPIDIVYTWVNGSDPRWKRKKDLWSQKVEDVGLPGYNSSDALLNMSSFGNESILTNSSTNATNSSGVSDTAIEEPDDTMSLNRYRDSEELRYSLRSLVQNAPWVRHIYIITDNQIPYWLNLESNRLTVLSHEDIFLNKSHLPVFSSPAIEANIHRIPGLSKKFIYFNDDVFLGSRVLPEDFITRRGVQKLVMSWDVPKCAPGCSDTWIGDGFCDSACNVSACNFDFPDCINGTNANSNNNNRYTGSNSRNVATVTLCTKGCPDNWLGDKICDARCKNAECGYDTGDCGLDMITLNFPGVAVDAKNARISLQPDMDAASAIYDEMASTSYGGLTDYDLYANSFNSENGVNAAELSLQQMLHPNFGNEESNTTDIANNTVAFTNSTDGMFTEEHDFNLLASTSMTTSRELQPALTVVYPSNAVYFDLGSFMCLFAADRVAGEEGTGELAECVPGTAVPNVVFEEAEHDDDDMKIVHTATILKLHNVMVVLLYHGQEGAPVPDWSTIDVKFTVRAVNSVTGVSRTATFVLRVVMDEADARSLEPSFKLSGLDLAVQELGAISQSMAHSCDDEVEEIVEDLDEDIPSNSRNNRNSSSSYLSLAGTHASQVIRQVHILFSPYIASTTPAAAPAAAVTSTTYKTGGFSEGVIASLSVAANDLSLFSLASSSSSSQPLSTVRVRFVVSTTSGAALALTAPLCDVVLVFAPESGSFHTLRDAPAALPRASASASDSNSDSDSDRPVSSSNAAKSPGGVAHCPQSVPELLAISERSSVGYDAYLAQRGPPRSPRFVAKAAADAASTSNTSTVTHGRPPAHVTVTRMHLLIPLPHPWHSLRNHSWYHVQAEVYVHAGTGEDVLPSAANSSNGAAAATAPAGGAVGDAVDGMWAVLPASSKVSGIQASDRLLCLSAAVLWGANKPAVQSAEDVVATSVLNATGAAPLASNLSLPVVESASVGNSAQSLALSVAPSLAHAESPSATVDVDHVAEAVDADSAGAAIEAAAASTDANTADIVVSDGTTAEVPDGARRLAALESNNRMHNTLQQSVAAFVSRIWKDAAVNLKEFVSGYSDRLHKSKKESKDQDQNKDQDDEHARRRLVDTYAASLVHVNRIYSKAFGVEGRKVPAHVPHMIDKDYMQEMQDKWPEQWNVTSGNRFRSTNDMQYSFSYYYYLVNRFKALPPKLQDYFSSVVDVDHDGLLNENELRTVATMVKGSASPSDGDIDRLLECIANSSAYVREHTEEATHYHPQGSVRKTFSVRVHPTIEQVLNCSEIVTGATKYLDWSRIYPTHVLESDKDSVAFEMIGDNYTISVSQLDSVRARQSKFVCINDNMKNPSPELELALRRFYESFFPKPCIFELPPGKSNPTLYLDEYKQLRKQYTAGLLARASRAGKMSATRIAAGITYYIRAAGVSLAYRMLDLFSLSEGGRKSDIYIHRLREDIYRKDAQFEHVYSSGSGSGSGSARTTTPYPYPQSADLHEYISHAVLITSIGVVGVVMVRLLSRRPLR